MYGVKGTSNLLSAVTRQSVLAKQLTGVHATPVSSLLLSSRNVTAAKLPLATRASFHYNTTSEIERPETSLRNKIWISGSKTQTRFQHTLADAEKTVEAEKAAPLEVEAAEAIKAAPLAATIKAPEALEALDAATTTTPVIDTTMTIETDAITTPPKKYSDNPYQDIIEAFEKSIHSTRELSAETYEEVMAAYNIMHTQDKPVAPMLTVYMHMTKKGIQPTSLTYAYLIKSLCTRDAKVNKTLSMLRRQSARYGAPLPEMIPLEKENNIGQAMAIFDQAIAENATHAFDIDIYNQLLNGMSKQENTRDGLYIYEQLEQNRNVRPNGNTFMALMLLFGGAKNTDAVLECFKEYKTLRKKLDGHDPAHIYNALSNAYVRAEDVPSALHVVETLMVKEGVRCSIMPYNRIIRLMCQQGDQEKALELVRKLKTTDTLPSPTEDTYANLLTGYCNAKDYHNATEMYDQLLTMNVIRQFGHLADYIHLCSTVKKPESALKALRTIAQRGIGVDVVTGRVVLRGFIENRRVPQITRALRIVFGLYSKNNFINEHSPFMEDAWKALRMCTDISSANAILDITDAYHVLPMKEDAEHYLSVYDMTKASPEAWQLFCQQATIKDCNRLFISAFRMSGSSPFADRVIGLLKDMIELKLIPNVSIHIRVKTRFKKYNYIDYLNQWEELMAPYVPAMDKDMAAEEAQIQATPEHSSRMMSDVYSGEALEAAIGQKWEDVITILNQKILQRKDVPTPEAVRDIISTASRASLVDKAQQVYDMTIDSMSTLDNRSCRKAHAILYNGMLLAYGRNKQAKEMEVFYDKLRSENLNLSGDSYATYISVKFAATKEDMENALYLYERSKTENVRPSIYLYNILMSKLAKAKMGKEAVKLFNEMQSKGLIPTTVSYASVISACTRCNMEREAIRYFTEMKVSPRYQPRVGVFNNMMQFYIYTKPDHDKALEYYQAMLDTRLLPTAHTYRLLVTTYANQSTSPAAQLAKKSTPTAVEEEEEKEN